MRKAIVTVMVFSLLSAADAFASDSAVKKLGRGVANVITAPIEIPKEVRAHWIAGSEKTFHIIAWIFCGAIKGTVMTVARVGSGLWDIGTFPVALPREYAPLLRPDYVLDNWPKRKEGVIYKNFGDQ